MVSDPIADMLTRIRNGYLASLRRATLPYSKINESLAQILVREGYLSKIKVEDGSQKKLKLVLKYQDEKPAVTSIERISKPGRRIYIQAKQIRPVLSGLGMMILSTPEGLLTNKEAKKKNLGGEVICRLT